jgi:hypothetical protein
MWRLIQGGMNAYWFGNPFNRAVGRDSGAGLPGKVAIAWPLSYLAVRLPVNRGANRDETLHHSQAQAALHCRSQPP